MRVLKTGPGGLSEEEARRRLSEYGPNELRKEKKKSPLVLFFEQFRSYLIVILLVATVLSLILGEILDAITILAIVMACAVLGFVEEYRSERALELLKKLAAPTALAIREGKEQTMPARELVPGDVVILHTGDKVPADVRLIEAVNLKVDEAPLTGESVPVEKIVRVLPEETPVPDRVNMGFSGTTVTYGRGKGAVTATGMMSEFGKIAAMVQVAEEEETPLEKRMAHVGKWLGTLCLVVCGVVALLGFIRGHTILEMLIWGVSLAIAAVPEALPAVVTGALAIGMHEMARRNAVVRRLPAVETLGCTSIICADKTGTMTKGEMTVRKIYVNGEIANVTGVGYEPKGDFYRGEDKINPNKDAELMLLLKAAALCNDAKLAMEEDRWIVRGDATEGALIVAAAKAGMGKDELRKYPRVGEVPFTSERKRMTTIHTTPEGENFAFVKGAPEIVLERCKWMCKHGRTEELTNKDRDDILKVNEAMAGEALRNLAIAYKQMEEAPTRADEEIEKDLVFLGIAGMIDPPREEAKEAIKLCKRSGIKTVMITGDHKLTAMMVAKELEMTGSEEGKVLTGTELDKMSDEEFERVVEDVAVYARVSPAHKVRIVDALKKKGYIAAMTGDGVNDAPALKRSDIGVAMGITGTDVTKEASDMVLADDNFATIVAAVREGRRIFDNIKKYLSYLLQCNIAEILVMLIAVFIVWPTTEGLRTIIPLTAIQLLWVNLTTDGLPALALGVDPADPDVMERAPRDPKESVFSRDVKTCLIVTPLIVTAILLVVFVDSLVASSIVTPELELRMRTRVFASMVFMELAIAVTCRSLKCPLYKVGVFANKFLWIAIASSVAMQLAVLYIPQLHPAFDITFPTFMDWVIVLASALLIFVVMEMRKAMYYRLHQTKKMTVSS